MVHYRDRNPLPAQDLVNWLQARTSGKASRSLLLGECLHSWRRMRDLPLKRAAEILGGIDQCTLSRLERGIALPSAPVLEAVMEALLGER